MNKSIEELNKLIAEFMGGIYKSKLFDIDDGSMFLPYWNITEIKNLNYHKSWDWLMPVVEKIIQGENYLPKMEWTQPIPDGYEVTLCEETSPGIGKTVKEATYNAVINYIK